MPPAPPRCCAPWTLGRLYTQASHNSGTPIKYLICRNSPRCKKSQHKGYSCVVSLTRGRRCQPHPAPSLTEAAVSLLNATLRWQTWVCLSRDFSTRVVVWVCLEGVLLDFLERPWRLLCVGLLESWRHQRYAVDYIRPPIQLGALLLALFWLHMDGDTSCGPHLCVFILSVILAVFYASAATRESEKE